MENYQSLLVILISTLLLQLQTDHLVGAKRCLNCGHTPVPYPLSSSPDCGDQSYKVRCNLGTLWLDTLNESSYMITSINPLTQRLIIRPPGLATNACVSADYASGGLWLDNSLPFNITSSNTVMLMNCSTEVFQLSWNCSSSSVCHDFVKANAEVSAVCGTLPVCCWYKTGGSITEYKIRVRKERCSAYGWFVNLDTSLAVEKWVEPGLEIEWALPQEPLCRLASDCGDMVNSDCLPDLASVGQRRCFFRNGFMWDPTNGFCNNNVKSSNGRQNKRKKIPFLIGALAAGLMLLGVLILVMLYKLRERMKKEAHFRLAKVRKDILDANNTGKSAKIFSSKEITRATNNFSKSNLLGSGGFGEVFKGILDDSTIIAVKRAKNGNTKGINLILNEVRILCQLNHRSLVFLLGCCVELEQPMLIYEYVPNGTLFDHLHSSKWTPLTWLHRLQIAHQTADGLAYLHTSAIPRIYHRDVKSSNILLDEKLNAKVADFGLSRLVVTESSHITTCAQGTLGYLDPEYYLNFQLTDKSDVYSFGVVLLELLTSKKVIDFNREEEDVNLVVFFKRVLKEERLMDIVDPVVKEGAGKVEMEMMKGLGSLAVACLDENRHNRPAMKEVSDEIEYIIGILSNDVCPVMT